LSWTFPFARAYRRASQRSPLRPWSLSRRRRQPHRSSPPSTLPSPPSTLPRPPSNSPRRFNPCNGTSSRPSHQVGATHRGATEGHGGVPDTRVSAGRRTDIDWQRYQRDLQRGRAVGAVGLRACYIRGRLDSVGRLVVTADHVLLQLGRTHRTQHHVQHRRLAPRSDQLRSGLGQCRRRHHQLVHLLCKRPNRLLVAAASADSAAAVRRGSRAVDRTGALETNLAAVETGTVAEPAQPKGWAIGRVDTEADEAEKPAEPTTKKSDDAQEADHRVVVGNRSGSARGPRFGHRPFR
jgi:hypothetical protein